MDSHFAQLRADLAGSVPEAEDRLHRHAQELYNLGQGEVTQPYYELVILAAELAARQGQLTREQTLLRRALLIAGQMKSDTEDAKGRLEKSIAWPEIPLELSSDRIVVAIHSVCDLWRWQPATIEFAPSGPKPYRWYMLAPLSWRDDFPKRVQTMLEVVFARCNTRLAAREPTDANYIGAQPLRIAELTHVTILAEAWEMSPTTWSEARGFVVEDSGWFFASNANDFVPMAHLALVTSGRLDNERSMARLREIGFSGDILERQKQPVKELAEALAYYVMPAR